MKVLNAMGCYDVSSHTDVGISSPSLAGCMIAAGVDPLEDPFLMCMLKAYRSFALKSIRVRPLGVTTGSRLQGWPVINAMYCYY
jgi:hypothetical protein